MADRRAGPRAAARLSAVSALQVDGAVVRLGGRTVVDRVDLAVAAGTAVAVLGPNGAGKTTLFRAIAGTVRLAAGRVHLLGRRVDRLPLHARARRGLGYLAQEASAFRSLTVRDNLKTVLELRVPRAERAAELAMLLATFGLEGRAGVRADRLSGGERRRTELARVMAARPRVLVLDEPFAGLDPRSADEVEQVLGTLVAGGATVVFSDHAVARALARADAALVLAGGRPVAQGPSDAVRVAPEARRVLGGAWSG